MTLRARPPRRRLTSPQADEARRQRLVTIGFVAVSALAVLILGGSVAYGWYRDHLAPIASVHGQNITVDDWRNRVAVDIYQLDLLQRHLRDQVAQGKLSNDTVSAYIQQLQSQQSQIPSQAVEELIDDALQAQLAPSLGVTLSEADIDAAIAKAATAAEQRHVLAIAIDPLHLGTPTPTPGPTSTPTPTPTASPSSSPTSSPSASPGASAIPTESPSASPSPSATASPAPSPTPTPSAATAEQIAQARARAEEALAKLTAGAKFSDVAIAYSTDPSGPSGGDVGLVTQAQVPDDAFAKALFALPAGGTTDVIEGKNNIFWIGRVTEIAAASTDPHYLGDLNAYGVDRAAYRAAVAAQLRSQKMSDALVAQATSGTPDQVHAYQILVRQNQSSPSSNDAEAHVLHILYSPNGDATNAASVPEIDPAWTKAQQQAEQEATALRAIADAASREQRFRLDATQQSNDSGSASNGGDLGWITRATQERSFGDAVFEGQHRADEIIGPVKTRYGWHVILFLGLRAGATDRINAIRAEVTAPGADFAAIARQKSEGGDAASGGDMGWIVKYQLAAAVEKVLFGLQAGQVSDVITDSAGLHLYFVKERGPRAVDADQTSALRSSAFTHWYDPQKTAAAAEIWRNVDLLGQLTGTA